VALARDGTEPPTPPLRAAIVEAHPARFKKVLQETATPDIGWCEERNESVHTFVCRSATAPD
jgi:hypothetical protein